MTDGLPLSRWAVIGKSNAAIAIATAIRRAGVTCHTEYTGKRSSQYKRASSRAMEVIDGDNPESVAKAHRWLELTQ